MGSSGDHWTIGCEVLEKELYLDFVLPTSPAEERPLAEEVRPPFPVCKAFLLLHFVGDVHRATGVRGAAA